MFVQYKIISRIMCNQLKKILPDIISETQGAHELVHGLLTNDTIGRRSMAVKTDMSKA